MLVQVGLEGKAFVAALAGVMLECRVCLHVGSKVGAVGEGLATMGAGKGLLSCMGPQVTLQ